MKNKKFYYAIGIIILTLSGVFAFHVVKPKLAVNPVMVSYPRRIVALAISSPAKKHAVLPSAKLLMPRPTERGENESEEDNLKREEWYNNMHRAAPGVNWKKQDEETRFSLYRAKYLAQNKTNESLDSGKIIGTWIEKGSSNQAGRMLMVDLDTIGNFIYGASGGGNIWRGNMDGTHWVCLNEGLKFSYICMLRVFQTTTGKRILVLTSNNTFYYTDDDGVHWIKSAGLDNAVKWGAAERGIMVNDSAKTIYLLLQEWDYKNSYALTSVYKSASHGADFKRIAFYKQSVFGGTAQFDIWSAYYGNTGKLYLLNDSGLSVIEPKDTVLVALGKMPYKHSGNIYLSGTEKQGNTWLYAMVDTLIYSSANEGKTWQSRGSVSQTPYTKWSFHCSILNPDLLQVGNVNCHISVDGGDSWKATNDWSSYYADPDKNLHADIQGILSFRNGAGKEITYVCNDGGLFTANDSVTRVNNISLSGLNVSQYYSTYTRPDFTNICYAGSQDQGYQRSLSDYGAEDSFSQIISGDYGHIVSGDDGSSIWMVYPGFAMFYPDAEASTDNKYFNFNFQNQLWMPPLMADPYTNEKVYLGGGSSSGTGSHLFTLSYDRNSGVINSQEGTIDLAHGNSGAISAMAFSKLDFSRRYVMTENGNFGTSADGGVKWTFPNVKLPAGHYFYGSCILPSAKKAGRLWVSGSGYSNPGVYISEDDGKTFKALAAGLPSTLVFQIAADTSEQFIFAATELGPYVLDMQTRKWYDLAGTSAPDQTYWSVEYITATQTARFGTYGRGIWDFKMSHLSSAIKNETGAGMKENRLTLFPNPAKSNTMLRASGLHSGKAAITIFGQSGIICFAAIPEAGFDGKLEKVLDISSLKPGIYILELSQGGTKVEERLVVY